MMTFESHSIVLQTGPGLASHWHWQFTDSVKFNHRGRVTGKFKFSASDHWQLSRRLTGSSPPDAAGGPGLSLSLSLGPSDPGGPCPARCLFARIMITESRVAP